MKVYAFTQAALEEWVQSWLPTRKVYRAATQKGETCGTHAGWTEMTDCTMPPCGPAKSSVKTFYFPQPETMATYSAKKEDPDGLLMENQETPAEKQVVFGVRPCDGRSVELNNLPYVEDPFYQANRERTILVGFSCSEQKAICFCTQTGGSPYGTEGLDIALSQVGDTILAEIITDNGAELAGNGADLTEASENQIAELENLRQAVEKGPGHDESLKAKEMTALHGAPLWDKVAEFCLNCGACTFLCPTCYCFDIQDEVVRGQGKRIRYWDSCMFPLYTLHTTGHNPRGKKVQRVRNRFMHKLKYFPDRFGPFSCVGCGRCIQECPVNIDIREVLTDLLVVE